MNAAATISARQRFERVIYFFPLQLLLLHFKKNLFLLFFWVLLFGYSLNYFAERYGVAYQFLYPQYIDANSPMAFAMVGFALGGFILAFNLYTYVLHGFRFPFIATLNRPFLKFSINNFIIPLSFVLTWISASAVFQRQYALLDFPQIALNILGFVGGMGVFLIASLGYFQLTNKNVLSYASGDEPDVQPHDNNEMVRTNLHRKYRVDAAHSFDRDWRIETYLASFVKVGIARSAKHYKPEVLEKVFAQNHFNASLFELLLIVTFIVIGSFRENPYFVLPAAASVMLFFTIMLMLVSILYTWIRGWTLFVFLLVFFTINYSVPRWNLLNLDNHAYGLTYDGERSSYSPQVIRELNTNDEQIKGDFLNTVEILDRWRLKNSVDATRLNRKPKMVIINTSGGGSRSAVWTLTSLSYADSVLDGKLLRSTALISGSSGGMIGAAYLRELYLKYQMGETENLYNPAYRENMARDLLNPVIFSIATNDFFIRYQTVKDGDQVYTKDRAWAFEKQLNTNTAFALNKRLGDYKAPEQKALVPMLIMAPTIVNDGRRLIVSSTPVSYLCDSRGQGFADQNLVGEDVEFTRLFAGQNAYNLRFTSALRMNATFPYVMPIVTLPSTPPVEVMDAGLRDNFGTKTTLQFLYTFRNWINTNTSGVVIIQIRDVERDKDFPDLRRNVLNRMMAPLGSVYGNFTRMQDYNNDQMARYLSAWFENDIDIVNFQLKTDDASNVSLSWHLTEREKAAIDRVIHGEQFTQSVERLRELLLGASAQNE